MKGIKLVLLSFISAAMLTSCGMNNTNDNTAPSPESTVNTNHDNENKMTITMFQTMQINAGNAAGDACKDVGDAAGDVVEGVGDAAADVAEGVSDAVGGNDANNNGK